MGPGASSAPFISVVRHVKMRQPSLPPTAAERPEQVSLSVVGKFPRIREIADPFGDVVRISIEPHPGGALIIIDQPETFGAGKVMLDAYGVEVLLGYIMSARLAVPGEMLEEEIGGAYPTRFQLDPEPSSAVIIDQINDDEPLRIAAPLWDRVYAELCLVCAHAREFERRRPAYLH